MCFEICPPGFFPLGADSKKEFDIYLPNKNTMRTNRIFAGAAAALIATGVLSSLSCAYAAPANQKDIDRISARIIQIMGIKPQSVRTAPVDGLYEVVINRSRVFYVDRDAKYLIAGRIFDSATETDLTQKRMEELSRIDWKTLPLQDAIKVVYGKGERKIAVFTDANCTYCRILENSLRQADNVTVYNFMYPILNSRDIASNIVCAKNPSQTFQEHMLDGKVPASAKCDTSVLDRNLALGAELGITGTPAIIFANGSKFAGAMPLDQLRNALETQK